MGNDFKTAPLSTFDIVYEIKERIVLFHLKEGQRGTCEKQEIKLDIDSGCVMAVLLTYISERIHFR